MNWQWLLAIFMICITAITCTNIYCTAAYNQDYDYCKEEEEEEEKLPPKLNN